MSADASASPCLLFALRRESMYVCRALPLRRRFPGAPCRADFRGSPGRTVLLVEAGLGSTAMESTLRWCLSGPRLDGRPYHPPAILLAGFSGALTPAEKVGDLILASEVVDSEGDRWETTWGVALPGGVPCTTGRVLCVPELVGDPRAKLDLGGRHRAVAADMESAAVARLCHSHGIPFACLRAISDDCKTALSPHLLPLLRRGRVSPLRLAGAVLRHPALVAELARLARHTRRAAERLTVLTSFVFTPPGSAPGSPPGGRRSSCAPGPWRP